MTDTEIVDLKPELESRIELADPSVLGGVPIGQAPVPVPVRVPVPGPVPDPGTGATCRSVPPSWAAPCS